MREHKQNWRDIFSCFRVALDVRKIVLGTLGIYISILVIYLLMLACCTPETQVTFMDMLRHPKYGLDLMFGWVKTMPHSCTAGVCSISFGSAAFSEPLMLCIECNEHTALSPSAPRRRRTVTMASRGSLR